MSPTLYFITGISGSGKTTVGRKLVELGEVALDSKIQKGLFHFADQGGVAAPDYQPQSPEWKARYSWRLNKPFFDELLLKYASAPRIFLCGGADDLIQYWPLGKKVFVLWVDAPTLHARLNSPDRDNMFGKDTKTQEKLLERLDRKQARLKGLGGVPVDASRSVEEVTKTILELTSELE